MGLMSRGLFITAVVATLILVWAPFGGAETGTQATNLQFGNPGGNCTLLDKRYFIVCYDAARRVPDWVAYRLGKSDLGAGQERTEDFRPDPALDGEEQSELSDYRSSGFDRGHMAPAGDFTRSERAMSTTFLLSNMTPQRPRLNRGMWQRLESQVRELVSETGTAWIVTGAVFSNPRPPGYVPAIGTHHVAVPTRLYKVILSQDSSGTMEMHAFVLPNSINPLKGKPADFEDTVDDVERLTGLDFFNRLPDTEEQQLESEKMDWPF